jgi:hypothetical protein
MLGIRLDDPLSLFIGVVLGVVNGHRDHFCACRVLNELFNDLR